MKIEELPDPMGPQQEATVDALLEEAMEFMIGNLLREGQSRGINIFHIAAINWDGKPLYNITVEGIQSAGVDATTGKYVFESTESCSPKGWHYILDPYMAAVEKFEEITHGSYDP